MTHYINIREELYPLLRMESGYSNSSNKCCSCTIADVESGNQPLSHARSGNLNNQEGDGLDNRKLCGTYSDREPALGGAAPAKKEEN